MPRPNYTNVTIKDPKRYDKIRRMFESFDTSDLQWIDWISEVLESAALREKYLSDKYPHLKFIAKTSHGCVIEDTKENRPVTVEIRGGAVVAVPNDPQYIIFAMLNPLWRP